MFVHAAQRLGMEVVVLDPVPGCPAAQAADRHLCAAYDDRQALDELARQCVAVTTEFENVPAGSLQRLARRIRVAPSANAVAIAQDRLMEKRFFRGIGIPTTDFFAFPGSLGSAAGGPKKKSASADANATLAPPGFRYPAILKTRRMGYDGKWQVVVGSAEELERAWRGLGGTECIVECRLPLLAELSVVLARGFDGVSAVYPVFENRHEAGILASSLFPARLSPQLLAEACVMTQRIAQALDYHGVLCVEYFVVRSPGAPQALDTPRVLETFNGYGASEAAYTPYGYGASEVARTADEGDDSAGMSFANAARASSGLTLLANEMAPRPHNSAHATIEACNTSQFEQQARVLAGWPLGCTRQHRHACLINLLGERWWSTAGVFREPRWGAVAALPGASLHLYGKREARPGRKMGHLALCGSTAAELDVRVHRAMKLLEALSREGVSIEALSREGSSPVGLSLEGSSFEREHVDGPERAMPS
jgi:5-(carboxyamino)imidazole ribonucleotide synthase